MLSLPLLPDWCPPSSAFHLSLVMSVALTRILTRTQTLSPHQNPES